MKLKYVMFDLCFPVMFPMGIPHVDVVKGIDMKPTSAGFVHIIARNEEECACLATPGGPAYVAVSAFGESVGLGLASNTADGPIIQNLINDQ